MAETMTTSATGARKGTKPEAYHLLPRKGLDWIARVFDFGARKYTTDTESGNHNWRRGYEWSKSISAAMRHLTAFNDGETFDPESGLPHVAHAGFHILALLTWLEEQGEGGQFDDRYRPAEPVDGNELTDDDIQELADEAERGYNLGLLRGTVSVPGLVFADEEQTFTAEEPFSFDARDLLGKTLSITTSNPDALRLIYGGPTPEQIRADHGAGLRPIDGHSVRFFDGPEPTLEERVEEKVAEIDPAVDGPRMAHERFLDSFRQALEKRATTTPNPVARVDMSPWQAVRDALIKDLNDITRRTDLAWREAQKGRPTPQ